MVSTSSHASVDEVIANGTSEIEDDASRAHVAMNNKHFRLSIAFSLDRGSLRGTDNHFTAQRGFNALNKKVSLIHTNSIGAGHSQIQVNGILRRNLQTLGSQLFLGNGPLGLGGLHVVPAVEAYGVIIIRAVSLPAPSTVRSFRPS